MPSLEHRNGQYRVVLRFGGRKYTRSLKTNSERAARATLARLDDNLRRVELGTLEVPDDADVISFLLSDGRTKSKPRLAGPIRLDRLITDYFAGLPAGSIEESTLRCLGTHTRHLLRILGGAFVINTLNIEDLESYGSKRGEDPGLRGRKVSGTTVKKELATFHAIWSWAERRGLVSRTFPKRGMSFPKTTEKPALLPLGITGPEDPVALVTAAEVVPALREAWAAISKKAPDTVTVVSPFWAEGSTAAAALADIVQQLGRPANLELVCRGDKSPDGKTWLPVFDSGVAVELKKRLSSRLCLRAALPDAGRQHLTETLEDIGDETEEQEFAVRLSAGNQYSSEIQRSLHAKLILVDGTAGSVLYAGSSNCTRRGLGLGGPSNSEAGLVYRLTPRQRKQLDGLLQFAGPATEVYADRAPVTVQPAVEEGAVVPTFLSEVIATGSKLTIRFRDAVPPDLVLLMPIPSRAGDAVYWLLYRADTPGPSPPETITLDLAACPKCDDRLQALSSDSTDHQIQPHVLIEARWQDHSATFPVRFDDKTCLPLLLVGRKPTEGELIEYFLFGTEPDEWGDGTGLLGDDTKGPKTDAPIDTCRILAYFIRRFVQAIPGIEAEIRRAGYSRAALDAVLRGPTSPLELAERAFASLARPATQNEPQKTPTAVGFQLTEILAALLRCQAASADPEMQGCFDPVIVRCREMLNILIAQHAELQAKGFRQYQAQILGDPQ